MLNKGKAKASKTNKESAAVSSWYAGLRDAGESDDDQVNDEGPADGQPNFVPAGRAEFPIQGISYEDYILYQFRQFHMEDACACCDSCTYCIHVCTYVYICATSRPGDRGILRVGLFDRVWNRTRPSLPQNIGLLRVCPIFCHRTEFVQSFRHLIEFGYRYDRY